MTIAEPAPAAVFSPCATYRYVLRRRFLTGSGTVNFIMLNPSTADETADDPTIRRCISFAQRWGYADLVVTNLFAYRATDPSELAALTTERVEGYENNYHLIREARAARLVVSAWGVHGTKGNRDRYVRWLLEDLHSLRLHHLGLTKGGHPRHPLYLRADTEPTLWKGL